MKTVLFLFSLLMIVTFVEGGTRDPQVPDEKYVEYGKQFDNVVLIKVVDSETSVVIDGNTFSQITFAEASAVVIKSNWVVTAGHVVYESKGTTIIKDKKIYPVTKTIIHKDYNHEANGVYDIAVCYSPEDFGFEKYVELYRNKDEIGKNADIAGFGRPGNFLTGAGKFDWRRRAGSNRIDGSAPQLLFCSPSRENGCPLEFMITPGDSGGGLFIDGKLAGINSFLRSFNLEDEGKPLGGRYGQESAFTRMSEMAAWVEDVTSN